MTPDIVHTSDTPPQKSAQCRYVGIDQHRSRYASLDLPTSMPQLIFLTSNINKLLD